MLTMSVAIGVLIVVAMFLLRVARGRRQRQPDSPALDSLGPVSPRWLIEHRY